MTDQAWGWTAVCQHQQVSPHAADWRFVMAVVLAARTAGYQLSACPAAEFLTVLGLAECLCQR